MIRVPRIEKLVQLKTISEAAKVPSEVARHVGVANLRHLVVVVVDEQIVKARPEGGLRVGQRLGEEDVVACGRGDVGADRGMLEGARVAVAGRPAGPAPAHAPIPAVAVGIPLSHDGRDHDG